ncbi:hypothetical protein SAMN04489761_2015 [Tenacibaculum sp. MAR_2009_124]|nr:hypothetical protein SAMN04489761_2015 [Tenacibaculum sp. MAR_2009_124]
MLTSTTSFKVQNLSKKALKTDQILPSFSLKNIDNSYATSLELVFKLQMATTSIVNKDRGLIYSFVPEDYTERLGQETNLEVLKTKH